MIHEINGVIAGTCVEGGDMAGEKPKKKIFYGWVIVAACFYSLFWAVGMYSLTAGAFVVPICTDLGFSRATYSLARTAISMGSFVTAALHAKRIMRFGVRKVMLLGLAADTLSFLLLSFSSRAWQFFLLSFLQGVYYQCINFSTMGFLINLWFEDDRGLASGLAYAGSGFGGSLLLTAARAIVERYSWRVCYRVIAAAGPIALLPVILFVIRDRPEHMRLEPYRRAGGEQRAASSTGVTLAEAKKMKEFWALTIGVAMMYVTTSLYTGNYLAHLQNEGFSYAYAASITSIGMLVNTAAKVTLGMSYDKIGVRKANLLVGGMFIVFGVSAFLSHNVIFAWMGGIAYNLCAIGVTVSFSYLLSRYFGNKDYPAIYATASSPGSFVAMVMPTLSGLIFDWTGSYRISWLLCLISGVIAAVCLVISEQSYEKRMAGN